MKESELILNSDGSIYHLALLPEDIADTIILVGDPDRVSKISKHFDSIEIKKQRREFITHTGWIGQKRLTVISSGIGTDNIDIVLNELDALVNIDLVTRKIKSTHSSLTLIRIGTSGSVHPTIYCDDILVSRYAIGIYALGQFYGGEKLNHGLLPSWAYFSRAHDFDLTNFHSSYKEGITLTCPGFYAPQARTLRIPLNHLLPFDDLHKIKIHGFSVTNMEMETAGIYLLAEKLGHRAISFNAILAERLSGRFSTDPNMVIQNLIRTTLDFAAGIV
ncbi:MAG: nucleoside phosphorylase [Saprospiraceae bacterium]